MRIRTIKPEFWSHPVLSALDDGARLLAIGLLNLADDEGYFLSHPTLVRNALRPFDEDSSRTRRGLETLEKVGWIEVRDHPEQGQVGKVINFQKHQRIDRPTPSKIGGYFNSTSNRRGLVEASLLERKGKEGNGTGKGMDGASPNGSPISVEATEEAKPSESRSRFKPPTREELNLEAAKIGLPDAEVDKFVAYYGANGWKVGKNPMKSWSHALVGWAARWRENHGPRNAGTGTGQSAVVAQRNAIHGPGIDAHIADALRRSREHDAEVERRMEEEPGFVPFGERQPELPGEGLRHG